MRVTKLVLTKMNVTEARIATYLAALRTSLPRYDIDTPLRLAHFLAQVMHESGSFSRVVENLNYSSARLLQVFPKYFTPAQARAYANQPRRIGNRVYASRLGNGDEASGDGYLFRGRGLIQLTGRSNYLRFSTFIEQDVVRAPARVASDFAVLSAVYFWTSANLNLLADADDLRGITRKVNGALNGLESRGMLLARLKTVLGIAPVDVA